MPRKVIIKADGLPLKGRRIYRGDKILVTIVVIEKDQDELTTGFDFNARLADMPDDPPLISKIGSDFTITVNNNRLDASFILEPADTQGFDATTELEYDIQRTGNTYDPTTLERAKFTVLDDISQ